MVRNRGTKKPMAAASEAFSGNLKEKDIHIKLGPSGNPSPNGVNWDDGVHHKIEKILLGYSDEEGITSIQAVYSDSDNIHILGPRHGSNELATSFKMINIITKPVTRIDATYQYDGISSLEFSSSEGSYGLVGIKTDDSFTFKSDDGFSGLHGHADDKFLTSLGVYINTSARKYLTPSSS